MLKYLQLLTLRESILTLRATCLSDDSEELFGRVLDRVDRETGAELPGPVPAVFARLAIAREGLSDADLSALLAAAAPAEEPAARDGAAQPGHQVWKLDSVHSWLAYNPDQQFYSALLWRAEVGSDPTSEPAVKATSYLAEQIRRHQAW